MIKQARNLGSLDGIMHGFFGRRGGVSEGPFASLNVSLRNADETSAAWTNRTRIADHFENVPERLIVLRQVHGTEIFDARLPFDPHDPPEGDGVVSSEPGTVLGVTTADCAPLLIADPKARVVGAAHAGWRGALDGVGDRLIDAMEQQGGDRNDMVAAIGPCIGQSSYEIGDEFEDRFLQHDPKNQRFFKRMTAASKSHFNLAGYLASRVNSAGIGKVEAIAADTLTLEDEYFSYRRSCLAGDKHFGLQLSAIALV